jgi:two-component system alkaline phosphatase synthesis response regulator PhoP
MVLSVKPEVVVVEDDGTLAQTIKRRLELANMKVMVFTFVEDVLNFFQRSGVIVHLLLIDLNLPDGNGLVLFKQLLERKITIPTIFVTGVADEKTKIQSLDMGGDDYLVKPFSLAEMISRINAVLRRAKYNDMREEHMNLAAVLKENAFHFCGVPVWPVKMELCFPSGSIRIGKREIGIMSFLSQNPHVVVSRMDLIQGVWGRFANVKSRSLDQYVMKIRRLLQMHHYSSSWLETIHGVGYCYRPACTDNKRKKVI